LSRMRLHALYVHACAAEGFWLGMLCVHHTTHPGNCMPVGAGRGGGCLCPTAWMSSSAMATATHIHTHARTHTCMHTHTHTRPYTHTLYFTRTQHLRTYGLLTHRSWRLWRPSALWPLSHHTALFPPKRQHTHNTQTHMHRCTHTHSLSLTRTHTSYPRAC